MGRYIGIDLHRNCFTSCIQSENGRSYLRTWRLDDLDKFCSRLQPDDEIAVEVTSNTRLFHDAFSSLVYRVVVVNPHQFRVISDSVNKTDENDARRLALFLSKGLLPEVRMSSKEHAQVKSLAQSRDKLVKLRTALKNKINNICSAHGINLKKETLGSEKGLKEVLAIPFDPVVKIEVRVLVDQIRSLNKSVKELEEVIKDTGSKLRGYKNLKSIKGIGGLGASILLSVIENVDDFADEGKLASYFGIVPRVDSSNETLRTGRITKRGNKLGRTTLVQCSLIAKRYSPYLHSYHERIKSRRGGGKANIALARKFLNVIYYTLKNDWVWEDFPNGELAEG
jgi:transposase